MNSDGVGSAIVTIFLSFVCMVLIFLFIMADNSWRASYESLNSQFTAYMLTMVATPTPRPTLTPTPTPEVRQFPVEGGTCSYTVYRPLPFTSLLECVKNND